MLMDGTILNGSNKGGLQIIFVMIGLAHLAHGVGHMSKGGMGCVPLL